MCLALTKAGKPCKNNGEVNRVTESEVEYSCTCRQHRNYFTEHLDEWKKHVIRKNAFSTTLQYQMKQLLETKTVIIQNKEDPLIRSNRYQMMQYIPLFAMYVEGYCPEWNKHMFDTMVNGIAGYWRFSKDFNALLCLARCSTHQYILTLLIENYLNEGERHGHGHRKLKHFLDMWIPHMLQRELYLLEDLSASAVIHTVLNSCAKEFGDDYNTVHAYHRKYNFLRKKKEKIAPFKEDLMAATWHPSRMQAWCLDEEEKEFLRNNTSAESGSNAV
jgi:hypothetical protein